MVKKMAETFFIRLNVLMTLETTLDNVMLK